MANKKGKALALELMDDLLNDESEAPASPVEKQPAATNQKDLDSDVEAVEGFDFSKSAVNADVSHTHVSEATSSAHTQKTTPAGANEDDHTMRIPNGPAATQPLNMTAPYPAAANSAGVAEDRVRASVGRFGTFRSTGPASHSEAALAQSESLRIAQNRLLEFEQEIERLRLQNEELAAAGETLRRRTDELLTANQKRESDYQYAISTFRQEKEILTNSKDALQRDLEAQRQKNEELDLRISTNIQKIRVRERELENRLELVRMESAALIRSKDEMILDLKRQIDQLNLELSNYRNKNQELNRQTTDKQEMLRRTVKALRLALSMLEGEEEAPKPPARKAK